MLPKPQNNWQESQQWFAAKIASINQAVFVIWTLVNVCIYDKPFLLWLAAECIIFFMSNIG